MQKRPTSWAAQYKEGESTASTPHRAATTAGASAGQSNQDEESGTSSEHGTDDITNLIRVCFENVNAQIQYAKIPIFIDETPRNLLG